MSIGMNFGEFKLVPEGEVVLFVKEAKAVPSGRPNKIQVNYVDQDGGTINAEFKINNDKAMFAFSMLWKTAMGTTPATIEPQDIPQLNGKYVLSEVTHSVVESTKEEGKMLTFANVKKTLKVVDGFGETETNDGDDSDDGYGI